jgi:hypothetical protein
VWNNLPSGEDLHWCAKYRSSWKRIRVLAKQELPEAVRNKPLTIAWQKFDEQDNAPAPDTRGTKKAPKYRPVHHEGRACVFTLVDANYLWYIPLFVYSVRKSYPEYDVRVAVRNPVGEQDYKHVSSMCLPMFGNRGKIYRYQSNAPSTGYCTAALRFLDFENDLNGYDYVLIQDSDMLMFREDLSIVDQHMMHLVHDGTLCYENWITEWNENRPRMAGVHFVTKDWWRRTREVRENELAILTENWTTEYNYDEFLLGRIAQRSRLPLPPYGITSGAKLWRHHGVHIGDWRLNIDRKFAVPPDVFTYNYIHKLLNDQAFMDIAKESAKHIPFIGTLVARWPQLFRG